MSTAVDRLMALAKLALLGTLTGTQHRAWQRAVLECGPQVRRVRLGGWTTRRGGDPRAAIGPWTAAVWRTIDLDDYTDRPWQWMAVRHGLVALNGTARTRQQARRQAARAMAPERDPGVPEPQPRTPERAL